MAATESVVTIRVGGGDVSAYAIWAESQFSVSASASPGTCRIALRDPDGVLSFEMGSIIELLVDGVRMWRGYLFDMDMDYIFTDGSTYRKHVLGGVDLNIILDKLILYNRTNPKRYPDGGGVYKRKKVTVDGKTMGYQVTVPRYTTDASYIKTMMADFDIDLISPNIKYKGSDNKISKVGQINPDGAFAPPSAGQTLRDFLTDVSRNVERSTPGSTIWYIDPDGYLVYKEQDRARAPFWVGDEDPDVYYNDVQGENVRGLSLSKSISSIKNDALVFAGELDPQAASKQTRLRYSHKIRQGSVDTYGRFQYSETLQNSWLQGAVKARAQRILQQEGTPGESARFTTFRAGLYPGQIIWIVSKAHGTDEDNPKVTNIPIRTISMTFKSPTIVQYDVSCSFDSQDPWGLILALKRPDNRGLTQPDFIALDLRRNPDRTIPPPSKYTFVKEYPQKVGGGQYQCAYPYIRNSITVFVGKLRQVSMQDPEAGTVGFKESSPSTGIFRLPDDPGSKRVYVEYHIAD